MARTEGTPTPTPTPTPTTRNGHRRLGVGWGLRLRGRSTLLVLLVLAVLGGWGWGAQASWWGSDSGGPQQEQHEHAHDHDHDQEHTHDEEAAEDKGITKVVTCGSVVKLKHAATGYRLHSHQVAYGSGSGQQSVTAIASADDANSFWIVRGAGPKRCLQGEVIKNGDVIRLQHHATKRNLHSHLHRSPLSRQQEVSCYGEEGSGDSGDNWVLNANGPVWQRGEEISLLHQDTNQYLHSHDMKYKHPIAGQQEVTAVPNSNANTRWVTEEGIFFPERKTASKAEL